MMMMMMMNDLVKVIQSSTHTAGHQLDVVVVRSDSMVPPPVVSDHSMMDVALGLHCSNQCDSSFYTCRSCRSFSYNDFEPDLLQSHLLRCLPDDVSELIAAYDDTLRSLIDIHAPYRRMRRSNRPSQCWFDAECRAAKRTTRSLERAYRRQPCAGTLSAWKSQFGSQRGLFQRKATEYWSSTFASCSSDAWQLWNKINQVIKPPTASQFTNSASDVAMHFVGKVDQICANTASATPPCVVDRQCASPLSTFQLVT